MTSYQIIMGGSQSKTVVNQLSEQISNIAMSTVQECSVSATQDQSLDINNSGFLFWGNYRLEQQTEIKTECFSDIRKQIDLQNKIIQAISQATTAQNVGLLGAFGSSKSVAETNLTNIIRNNITMSNIQKSYTAVAQSQTVKFNNSGVMGFTNVELVQGAKLFAAATLQELDRAGIFNTIESHIDQQSTAKVDNPLDFIANAISAVSTNIIAGILFFVVLLCGIIFGTIAIVKYANSEG